LAPDTHQIHDMSPGIAPSGLFWTVRIPDHWVNVEADDLDEGARYRVKDLNLLDYRKLANALPALPPGTVQTPPDAAVASFDMRWMGNLGPATPTASETGPNQFTYEGILTHATMSWSASVPSRHFKFKSSGPSHETFAELVNERNGSFLAEDDD
jgi:hypothetical protein